MDQKVLKIRQ